MARRQLTWEVGEHWIDAGRYRERVLSRHVSREAARRAASRFAKAYAVLDRLQLGVPHGRVFVGQIGQRRAPPLRVVE